MNIAKSIVTLALEHGCDLNGYIGSINITDQIAKEFLLDQDAEGAAASVVQAWYIAGVEQIRAAQCLMENLPGSI